jgi:hypothetical protein
MFILDEGGLTFEVEWIDGGFIVTANEPEGKRYVKSIEAGVELAYMAELSQASYMPTPEMTEYCTARRLGVILPVPDLEGEPGRVY